MLKPLEDLALQLLLRITEDFMARAGWAGIESLQSFYRRLARIGHKPPKLNMKRACGRGFKSRPARINLILQKCPKIMLYPPKGSKLEYLFLRYRPT